MVSKSRKLRKQKQQYYRQVNKVDEKYQKVEEKYQTEAAEEQSDTQIDQGDVEESTSSWNQRKDKVNTQRRFKYANSPGQKQLKSHYYCDKKSYIKELMRLFYQLNKSSIAEKRIQKYAENPIPVQKRMRDK